MSFDRLCSLLAWSVAWRAVIIAGTLLSSAHYHESCDSGRTWFVQPRSFHEHAGGSDRGSMRPIGGGIRPGGERLGARGSGPDREFAGRVGGRALRPAAHAAGVRASRVLFADPSQPDCHAGREEERDTASVLASGGAGPMPEVLSVAPRSEERRVGKECRSRW